MRLLVASLLLAAAFLVSAAPLQADFVTSSIVVDGDFENEGTAIRITSGGGNQDIVITACNNGTDDGICVSDANADAAGMNPEGSCGVIIGQGDIAFCRRSSYTRVVADLDAFDDRIEMRADLALVADGGGGNDRLIGGDVADTLRGGAFDDVLEGGDGRDTLRGESGDDTLRGGGGNEDFVPEDGRDTYAGGADVDEMDYSSLGGPVNVTVGAGANDGPSGEDDEVLAGMENLIGTGAADFLTGDAGDNTLQGLGGTDTLNGGDGADVLLGGNGAENDTLNGGPGAGDVASYGGRTAPITASLATLRGGQAGETDTYNALEALVGGSGDDSLDGNAVANRLVGGGGADTLRGRDGADELLGAAGDDALLGEGGDDEFLAESGADTATGGPGVDTASYEGRTAGVKIDLTNATASGASNGAEGDRLTEIENAVGSSGNDQITGTSGPNVLSGDAPPEFDSVEGGGDTIDGAAGDDHILGNGGPDALADGAGRDVVDGGFGNDAFFATGGENDVFDGDIGVNAITFFFTSSPVDLDLLAGRAVIGAATDQLLGGFGAVNGTPFNDVLRGDDGVQTIDGGPGDDQLFGRGGNDRLLGSGGRDQHDGGLGSDEINGGPEPNDIVDYSEATTPVTLDFDGVRDDGRQGENDLLVGIENVWGGQADDTITGGPETNVLYGNPGNDLVRGLAGNDTVTGGAGQDTLEGNEGNDTMEALDSTADNVNCGDGNDTITSDPVDVLDPSCEGATTFVVTPPQAESPPAGTPPAPGNQPLGGGVDPGPTPAPEDDRFVGVKIGTQNAGPPTVTGFSANPRRFRRRRGTTFAYTTNEAGAANVVLQRLETGRRVGGRCRKATRKNRNRRKCRRVVNAGTLEGAAAVGANQLRMPSRVRRGLKPGRHRATLTVSDAAGLKSSPLTLTLTVRR